MPRKDAESERRLACRVRELFTELGPTYIKLGRAHEHQEIIAFCQVKTHNSAIFCIFDHVFVFTEMKLGEKRLAFSKFEHFAN